MRNGRDYKCKKCGHTIQMGGVKHRESKTFRRSGNILEVESLVPRIMSDEQLLDFLKVDKTVWKIDRVKYSHGTSEAYRKDRKVEWKVRRGEVLKGDVHDTGKLLIAPLHSFRVDVWLSKRVEEVQARDRVADFVKQAKRFAPKYPKIRYPVVKDGMLYEIEMPDLHLGQLAWAEESGKNADTRMTMGIADRAVDALLGYVRGLPVARIMMPIGNDFFNVNDKSEETIHGTRQQEDGRAEKTFRRGEALMKGIIDRCSQIAPVDVVVVPGNHDEERMFYLGEYLVAWFHRNPNVTVNNQAKKRKYYAWAKVLIGLTHGYYEKVDRLGALMPFEEPELWANSAHREWHLGHLHQKKDLTMNTDELNNGVVVRILRSLAAPSTWMFDMGYVGARRAAEGFLWHPVNGLVGQFTTPPV